ncbi:hypothetical protein HN587_04335 [Candidatus Woesearchaeota archaeon]|jgi:large subunit ribosomal protein L31e|nr:hypothetical protein [Candidatus Woesearchaeota archaeon]
MADLERNYVIPLRKEWRKAVRQRRAKRAVSAVRIFISKHMKSENVLIGPKLNEAVWARGMQHPPSSVEVTAIKDKEGTVTVELVGVKFTSFSVKEKKEEGNSLMDKVKGKMGIKDEEPAKEVEAKTETKFAETKTETTPKVKEEAKPVEPKPKEAKPEPVAESKPKDVKSEEKSE